MFSKPWCKVCKDSGEPESVYTTHYVKDNKGNSVCPKLLALNCRCCGENGHTVKFCKTLKLKDIAEKKALSKQIIVPKKKKEVVTNMYDTLFQEDDDDEKLVQDFPSLKEEVKEVKEEEFLGRKINKKLVPMSYAAITQLGVGGVTHQKQKQPQQKQQQHQQRIPLFNQGELKEKKKFCWADAVSSSEGEEEEEEGEEEGCAF